ncbi:collagen-like protein [Neptunomonas japonica]|uniref:Uncharacterized protein n=1 Tax=Neptunomonas japonica JAMM 1380 TaxID=1441457 RepID=A0A7R6PAY8_9GAMM|nr:collagen-like protein [Neptunomonas japonica]BBB29139.1 hypothetical protein NEJAP_1186 [Neptunomonas japonica JAMM 1380]
MRNDYELYKAIEDIRQTISKDVDSKVNEEIEKRSFKVKTIFWACTTVLTIFGIGTWFALPQIAADTAKKIVKEETSLQVLGELKQKEIEIHAAHTNAMDYLSKLSNEYEEFSANLVIKLIDDNKFSNKLINEFKNNSDFIAITKGEVGEPGIDGLPGKNGMNGKNGEPGPPLFDGRFVYGSVSSDGQKVTGEDYTVSRMGGGIYKVTINKPFGSIPTIFVSAESAKNLRDGAIISIRYNSRTRRTFEVAISYGENNKLIDSNWQFLVIGK